jgi:signal transduction histidine kinase
MVEGIIERHKGNIEVTSEVGKGTTFTLKFPAKN